jgi:hypothetical protein
MRVIPGIECSFIPTGSVKEDLDSVHDNKFQGGQLYDLFVPASAGNCPYPTFRNRPNGHISGDIFEEVQPGYYAFRGRNDDWIRTGKTLSFCDTKYVVLFVLFYVLLTVDASLVWTGASKTTFSKPVQTSYGTAWS